MRRVRGGALAVAVMAVVLACAPAASAANSTWVGTDTSSTDWSQADNWSGNAAPTSATGTLTFFGNLGAGCDAGTSNASCYYASDDLGPLTVSGLALDSDSPYDIVPDDPTDTLALHPTTGFGIDSNASGTADNGPTEIDIPISTVNAQTWAIDGGGNDGDGVFVSQLDTAAPLTANLTGGGTLYLTDTTSAQPIEATGDGSGLLALTGTQAQLNSTVVLDAGTGFIDASPGANSVPITIDANPGPGGFLFAVGQGGAPDGTLNIDGPQSLGSDTTLNLYIDDNGTTPSADYSQLTTTNGGLYFGGAGLDLSQGNTSSGGCTTLTPGQSDTLISSPVGLTGSLTYSDWQGNADTLAQGETSSAIPLDPCVAGSTSISAYATVTYSAHALTATIVTAPRASAPPPTASNTPAAGPTLTFGATQQKVVTPIATVAQVRSALAGISYPSGRAIAELRRHRSFDAAFRAPSAGVVTVSWTSRANSRHRLYKVATGHVNVSGSGLIHVTIKLSAAGVTLLRTHPRGLSVIATERFRATGDGWIQVTRKFRV